MAEKTKIILASGSPRRRQLLSGLLEEFETYSPDVEEIYDVSLAPEEIAKSLSQKKAEAAGSIYPEGAIIAADTIVSASGEVLEKPKDEEEAAVMLKKLSGAWHEVYTGVCISHKGENSVFCEKTSVHFKTLDDELINWYVKTGEPMDKAGAYGIQGFGAMLVDRIEGDFYNVMGFPISKIMDELKRLDIYYIGRG